MQILSAPDHWPALPMTEIAVHGEDGDSGHVVKAIVSFLTDHLTKGSGPLIAA